MGMPSSVVNGVMGDSVTSIPIAEKYTSHLTQGAWLWIIVVSISLTDCVRTDA
jgi:hypothetical protein